MSDVSNLLFSTVSHKKSPYLLVIWKQCSIPILVTHNKICIFLLVVSYVLYITAWISVICKQCTHLYCELKMYWNLSDVSNVPKLNAQPYLHLPVGFTQCSYPYFFSHNTSCIFSLYVCKQCNYPLSSHTKQSVSLC